MSGPQLLWIPLPVMIRKQPWKSKYVASSFRVHMILQMSYCVMDMGVHGGKGNVAR